MPLQISANGGIQVTAGFDFELAFGYDANKAQTFLDSNQKLPNNGPELAVTVGASLPANFKATATIGFVEGMLTPIGQPGLTVNIAANNLDATPTVDHVTVQANVDMRLAGGFSGVDATQFPSIGADFHLNWSYDSANSTAGPFKVWFDNIGLDLGSFVKNVVGPVLGDIQSVTEIGPLKDVLQVLTERLPVISDLGHLIGKDPITLLDLAKATAPLVFPGSGPLADLIAELVTLINDINSIPPSLNLPLGGFDLSGSDLRSAASAGDVNNTNLSSLTGLVPSDIQNAEPFGAFTSGLNLPQAAEDGLNQLVSGVTDTLAGGANGIDIEFPIFNNPAQAVFGMLLGRDSDLFSLTATEQLDAQENSGDFSVFDMGLKFANDIKVDAKFKFGYDTYGLREMIHDGGNLSDLTDGFYIDDSSHLNVGGNIGLSAGLTVGLFSVSVNGGVSTGNGGQTPVSITINDPDQDGKLRLGEVPNNPLDAFQANGELDAGVTIQVKVGMKIGPKFIGYEKDFNIAHTVLVSFPPQTPPATQLAEAPDAYQSVNLDVGLLAGHRRGVDQTDGGENYTIRHVGDDSDGETIEIDAFNHSQTIHGVKSIIARGDQGDLTVNVLPGVESYVYLYGGQGHANFTYSGTGTATLVAGQADSTLTGGSGTNILSGGPGNDTFTTGPGDNIIVDTQGDNTIVVAGPFSNFNVSGSGATNTLEIVAQKTTTSVSVTPSNGYVDLEIDDSSAATSSALLSHISQLIVNAHGRSTNVTVGDLSGVGITSETIDVMGGASNRTVDLETRANTQPSFLSLNAISETYPDAKDPSVQVTEHGVAVVNGTTSVTTNVFGMSPVDRLTIHQHGGIANISDLGAAEGTVILDTASRQAGSLGESVTLTTPVQTAGSTTTTDGYGPFGSGGFRIRATGDPDMVVAGLQTSDNVNIQMSAAGPGNTNQVTLDASALVGALHVTALGALYYNRIQVLAVRDQAAVYLDGANSGTSVDVGVGDLAPIGGQVTVSNAVLTVDNSQRNVGSILTMTAGQLSGWNNPLIGPSTLYFGGLLATLTVDTAPGDRLDVEQTPAGITDATFNEAVSTQNDAYLAGASAPLTFNGNFALTVGERLLSDGTTSQTSDLTGLTGVAVTLNLSRAQNNPSSVNFLNPAGQSYTIGGNGNFVVADQNVGLSVTINGFGAHDLVFLSLPGGSVNADLRTTSLGTIQVDGSSRNSNSAPANNVTVTSNAASVTMQGDASTPQSYHFALSNEPLFLLTGMQPSDVLATGLYAPIANQVNIDASLLLGSLLVNALGDVSNNDNVTLSQVGQQAAVAIDGGAANTNVMFATGQLALIEHDATVRHAHLTVDNSAAATPSILTLTDSSLSGWGVANTNLTPVPHLAGLYDQTIEAGAGDRFDLESKLAVTINNGSATRDAVYGMTTGGALNGDFSLDMGWRLLADGTLTKPETLQNLGVTMTVNFVSSSELATQVVLDGNQDPAGATYAIGGSGNLTFANQTVGLSVVINGYRSQDQVTVDLRGGAVAADLRHTGPGTIYLDGSARLTGTNPSAANQYTVQARAGALTMQPDGADNSVFSLFNTLYLLGSLPQDSLSLTQTTNFKVAPTAAQAAATSYGMELANTKDGFLAGYATAYLQGTSPAGWVYNRRVPASVASDPQVPDGDRLSYFDSNGSTLDSYPATVLDAQSSDYLGDNVEFNDVPLTYAGSGNILRHDDSLPLNTGFYTTGPLPYGQLTVWERVFTVTSHPVPVDNTVTLDASQLRGAFHYTAADPNYSLLGDILGAFGNAAVAFGKTTVNLSGVNPQSAVTLSGQHALGFDYYNDAFLIIAGQYAPGANLTAGEIADNRMPTTSANVGAGTLASIQGNVSVQQARNRTRKPFLTDGLACKGRDSFQILATEDGYGTFGFDYGAALGRAAATI